MTSVADPLGEDPRASKSQVFQYDATTGLLVRASIGENGYNDDGKAPDAGSEIQKSLSLGLWLRDCRFAHDLGTVPRLLRMARCSSQPRMLYSMQALNDQHNVVGELVPNIYEYRAGHVYLLSDGHDTSTVEFSPGVYLAGSDPSGDNVFFFTSDSLLAGDGNTQQDLYDARVEGGFPAPESSSGCAGSVPEGHWPGRWRSRPPPGARLRPEKRIYRRP